MTAGRRRLFLCLGLAFAGGSAPAAAKDAAPEVRVAPSPRGRVGAWLVIGPFRSATFGDRKAARTTRALLEAPQDADESTLAPRVGAPWGPPFSKLRPEQPAWVLAASGDGPIDLKAALRTSDTDVVAYLAGALHVEKAGRYHLFVGSDDGVRVQVDGKTVLTRADARAFKDDADVVALDLAPGDHPLLFKVHQREGDWLFRARIVDANLQAPKGAYVLLPGTEPEDGKALAARMVSITHDRGAFAGGYAPRVTARFSEGAPMGVPLTVRSHIAKKGAAPDAPPLWVAEGEVPIDESGAFELSLPLGPPSAEDVTRLESAEHSFETLAAGRSSVARFLVRKGTREAVARATATLEKLAPAGKASPFPTGVLESAANLRNRLVRFASRGDTDLEAQAAEARELDAVTRALEQGKDPYAARTGPVRRALVASADGDLSEVGLYVPPSYRPGAGKKYPLVVALHGLNGTPMNMIRWFFGGDDPAHDGAWEDRHTENLPNLEAFVLAPSAHANATYRFLGEDDVMEALDWALATYPIDRNRVSITGPSMGGIGTAAIAFHFPDWFSAAAPLCGYQSYFVRGDVKGRALRPWERFLAEEKSNSVWAWNGKDLPLYVVHGTQDVPEANSGVLIERYEELKYSIRHEHPNLGHNVWQGTYEELRGAEWLLGQKRDEHPREVKFHTARLRYAKAYWVHVDELEGPGVWGEVDAKVRSRTVIEAKTTGVAGLSFDRDPALIDARGPLVALLDGQRIVVPAMEPPVFHRAGRLWALGPGTATAPRKRGNLTGPIRDVFHGPLVFVYGADDPAHARVNEEVARAWATVKPGVAVRYPVYSDAEFLARGEPLDGPRSLFLVGTAKENRVLRALEDGLPIRTDGDAILVGASRITGTNLGAVFVQPNPKRLDRYVAVVEGTTPLATYRSLALPELVPDFIVYDEAAWAAQGGVILGAGQARAAGFFRNDWTLPAKVDDPFARARPRTETAPSSPPAPTE